MRCFKLEEVNDCRCVHEQDSNPRNVGQAPKSESITLIYKIYNTSRADQPRRLVICKNYMSQKDRKAYYSKRANGVHKRLRMQAQKLRHRITLCGKISWCRLPKNRSRQGSNLRVLRQQIVNKRSVVQVCRIRPLSHDSASCSTFFAWYILSGLDNPVQSEWCHQ